MEIVRKSGDRCNIARRREKAWERRNESASAA